MSGVPLTGDHKTECFFFSMKTDEPSTEDNEAIEKKKVLVCVDRKI